MIAQMLPTLSFGDAIGNNVLAIHDLLKKNGYHSEIYAENIDKRVQHNKVKTAYKYKDNKNNTLIYHLSTGSKLNEFIKNCKSKVILVYHNITPPEYWAPYSSKMSDRLRKGLEEVAGLSETPVLCITDSDYNKCNLLDMGYECPIRTIPILINFADYSKTPDVSVLKKYGQNEYKNILFTGRIAPNKKMEDLIRAFYYYKKYINSRSRLLLVGAYNETDLYYTRLKEYVRQLDLDDVIFTGHISFEAVLAFYRIADIFVCLSEHEGFCVPLLEAMFFQKPIIAFDSTAVGETLGEGGFLIKDKSPKLVAELINHVLQNASLRNEMIANGTKRLHYFDHERIGKQILDTINLVENQ